MKAVGDSKDTAEVSGVAAAVGGEMVGTAAAVAAAVAGTTAAVAGTAAAKVPLSDSKAVNLRWRIHKGQLPMRRRHLKSLETLNLSGPLMAWVHERLEWAIANMCNKDTEAILVVSIDGENEVRISMEELQEPPTLSCEYLVVEGELIVGISYQGEKLPGTVWLERDGVLYASVTELTSATDTLTRDLAETLKISAIIEPQSFVEVKQCPMFLISDEFGFCEIEGSGNEGVCDGWGAASFEGEGAIKQGDSLESACVIERNIGSEGACGARGAAGLEGADGYERATLSTKIKECFAKLW